MTIQEITNKLQQLALKRSTPFCYSCYVKCPDGVCKTCASDDLMRITAEDGPEYGTLWIIEEILRRKLKPADLKEAFEESVRDCYPAETHVGWMKFDTVTLMKQMDPVSWRCALADYESQEESEGNIVSIDGGTTYYWSHDVEALLAEE